MRPGLIVRPLQVLPPLISGCVLWLIGDTGVTVVGGKVTTWLDQSGHANHATQISSGNQPSYSAVGINGKPSINNTSSTTNLVTGAFALGAYTWLISTSFTGAAGYLLAHGSPGAASSTYCFGSTGNTLDKRLGGNISAKNRAANWAVGAAHVTSVTYDGTHAGHTMQIDGVTPSLSDVNTQNPGTGSVTAQLGIGGNPASASCSVGLIRQVVVYNRALAASELATVTAYLRSDANV